MSSLENFRGGGGVLLQPDIGGDFTRNEVETRASLLPSFLFIGRTCEVDAISLEEGCLTEVKKASYRTAKGRAYEGRETLIIDVVRANYSVLQSDGKDIRGNLVRGQVKRDGGTTNVLTHSRKDMGQVAISGSKAESS